MTKYTTTGTLFSGMRDDQKSMSMKSWSQSIVYGSVATGKDFLKKWILSLEWKSWERCMESVVSVGEVSFGVWYWKDLPVYLGNSLVLEIIEHLDKLINSGFCITVTWVPSHIGIAVNTPANATA